MSKISFVIPCYYSEKTLGAVVEEIDASMKERNDAYEIIMVNDGSEDGTWETIRGLCDTNREGRKGINLAKNFGQHAALMAGIRETDGDIVLCLDDDGQTPADAVGKLIAAVEEGADVAYARYDKAHSSLFRSFGTAMNEFLSDKLLGKPKGISVTSFFAMKRFVANEVLRYENAYPYLVGLILRTTRNIVNVDVEHRSRTSGQSGYTFSKLLSLWMNGFTAFSVTPLRVATWTGSFFAFAGFLYGIYTIIKKFVNPNVPMGFSALISSIVFIGGMLMLMLGMVGEYVGRTYLSVNRAPQYVIKETTDARE